MSTIQISAHISPTTKEELERFADARGLKKGYVIEDALLHHLQALREIPDDVVVPVRLLLSSTSFSRVAERVRRPRKPTAAMRRLMKDSSES